ncbi:MAG: hypothetical protein HC795_05545 [Coleofasciculaceae cyanobacterium RL_1_1]|nr:hypothetical protein [Coleofasciculaceae cyanobacterium RL_1_1]
MPPPDTFSLLDAPLIVQRQRHHNTQRLRQILLFGLGGSVIAHVGIVTTGSLWWPQSPQFAESEAPIELVFIEQSTPIDPPPDSSDSPSVPPRDRAARIYHLRDGSRLTGSPAAPFGACGLSTAAHSNHHS